MKGRSRWYAPPLQRPQQASCIIAVLQTLSSLSSRFATRLSRSGRHDVNHGILVTQADTDADSEQTPLE